MSNRNRDLAVELTIHLTRDGTVTAAELVDRKRYDDDVWFRAAADSALRAFQNPHCRPLNLPADKFDEWKVLTVTLDARDLL